MQAELYAFARQLRVELYAFTRQFPAVQYAAAYGSAAVRQLGYGKDAKVDCEVMLYL